VGSSYAANTLGAVLGAFAGGFILIPNLGVQNTIIFAVVMNLAIGAWLVISDPKLAQPAASSAAARIADHGLCARPSTSDPSLRQQFWSIHRISSCFSVDLTVPELRSNITLKNIGFTCW